MSSGRLFLDRGTVATRARLRFTGIARDKALATLRQSEYHRTVDCVLTVCALGRGDKRNLTRGIHDYFITKSLDVIRPGGLLALITSRYTMDKQESAVREHLSDCAVLLGAIRLPNTAFTPCCISSITRAYWFHQTRKGRRRDGASWE